ncbi:MAG: addiction module protein [Chlorobium sp.]
MTEFLLGYTQCGEVYIDEPEVEAIQEVSYTVELSQTQMAELHHRVAAHSADPSTAVPWEQV